MSRRKAIKVVATIAVLNEEDNLPHVLSRMPGNIDVIVVDDGSTDGSARICRSYGARVVRHPQNLGQGTGVITGVLACLMGDYDIIIELDGDGQHDPADIPRFVATMESSDADIVVGSRILGSNYDGAPFFRRRFLPYFTWVINQVTSYDLTDSMCGFRAFRVSSLRKVDHILTEMQEPQYIAAEMFIRFSRAGLKVTEIPIDLSDRGSGLSYKGFVRYGWGVTRAILRTTLGGR